MKNLNMFESFLGESTGGVAPIKISTKAIAHIAMNAEGDNIMWGDKFWIVFVFQGPKGNRFKSMSREPQTMQNFINIAKGGLDINEIAGLFLNKEDAKYIYDSLEYPAEK